MLDDMFDYLENIRSRPVWQEAPNTIRNRFRDPLPQKASPLEKIHQDFLQTILPYSVGNTHPGFMGWVHGGGTPVGMLAEMLAAGLNANLGGRNQIPVAVEWQIVIWMQELFGFPDQAGGLFITGTSMANFLAVLAARTAILGIDVRQRGLSSDNSSSLRAYTSKMAHNCISKAFDMAGLGSDSLRIIDVDENYRMRTDALNEAITRDLDSGLRPFFVVATAGTVDVGSIDDISAIVDIARRYNLWMHVDGAYGALAHLSPKLSPLFAGIEHADSIAFDFHKWGQVPYDAGFILVRDAVSLQQAFSSPAVYLKRAKRGLAAGSCWPCDLGPDLSRGFRALKTWFTIKAFGSQRLGEMIAGTCALARYLKKRVEETPELELLAPVTLNIVCFRFRCQDADSINENIVIALQESGIAAPSTTSLQNRLAIRVAIVNHRTKECDIDSLIEATLRLGKEFSHNE